MLARGFAPRFGLFLALDVARSRLTSSLYVTRSVVPSILASAGIVPASWYLRSRSPQSTSSRLVNRMMPCRFISADISVTVMP